MPGPDFDERAATWDDDPTRVERARTVAQRILAAAPLSTDSRVLDYGAGTGLLSEGLKDHVGRLYLADPSAGMRQVAQAIRAIRIETHHPVAKCLPIHAADPGCLSTAHAIISCRQRQKPACLAHILGPCRQSAAGLSIIIVAKWQSGSGHGNSILL
jgi:ubiquinone/menaquinone biosynthesis C-methylase UbiE